MVTGLVNRCRRVDTSVRSVLATARSSLARSRRIRTSVRAGLQPGSRQLRVRSDQQSEAERRMPQRLEPHLLEQHLDRNRSAQQREDEVERERRELVERVAVGQHQPARRGRDRRR